MLSRREQPASRSRARSPTPSLSAARRDVTRPAVAPPNSQTGTTWRLPAARRVRETRTEPSSSRSSSTALTAASTQGRTPRQADDIPVFDRNKVSLDFPGSLFGPSVSLLIKTTKIIGDVIQNSAVRYQSFLRLFRPLFRGPFEIKGLDPATTTTTTTTAAPSAADNEVRRRRRAATALV